MRREQVAPVGDFHLFSHTMECLFLLKVLQEAAIKSLTTNGKTLVYTIIFGAILVYISSVITFVFFRPNVEDNACSNLSRCFATGKSMSTLH